MGEDLCKGAQATIKKDPSLRGDIEATLQLLQEKPFAPRLATHKLHGPFAGSWGCSVRYDLRVVFDFVRSEDKEEDDMMKDAIQRRNAHNEHATFIDALEEAFGDKRKLHGTIPLGLSFAWELGAMSRRERAIVGERIDGAKTLFEQGGNRRYFSFQNASTRNWLVFLFSSASLEAVSNEVGQLTKLKLIKEVHFQDFEFAVYGFGFQVSRTHPIRLMGLRRATVISPDAVRPYSDPEIEAAIAIWGDKHVGQPIPILEFPPADQA